MAASLFLIAQSKLKYTFFPRSQQVIGTNRKYTKWIDHYSYNCRFPGLSNRCTFALDNRLAGRFAPATELEFDIFWPSAF